MNVAPICLRPVGSILPHPVLVRLRYCLLLGDAQFHPVPGEQLVFAIPKHSAICFIHLYEPLVRPRDVNADWRMLKDFLKSLVACLQFHLNLEELANDQGDAANSQTEQQAEQNAG